MNEHRFVRKDHVVGLQLRIVGGESIQSELLWLFEGVGPGQSLRMAHVVQLGGQRA
jgi:hypothetical protein